MKTAMQELIEQIDSIKSYDRASTIYNLRKISQDLLKKEREQIVSAFDTGHINGWVDGSHDQAEQSLKGSDYFIKTYEPIDVHN